ncbi:alpha-L-fucosidase [Halosimplex amylolyticum]|uniref:alpha-L-fucosidase n=1 Tax=Halosimplex amylolyticum TaxID=3396616 RepID=UPI003F552972
MSAEDSDSPVDAPETSDEFRQAVNDAVERARAVIEKGPYDDEWESLKGHDEAPTWFRDAKFGIYCHWGLYSVPAHDTEWYPRLMHDEENDIHDHHVETYGSPDEAPYQEFVPEFTAENFDAEEWADLFEEIGAQFAGPIAEHHDGWSNWDSTINPWNAGDRGPKRDLVGELESAIRDRDMRFVTSFHHERTREHYEFAYENYPSVMDEYPDEVMYGNIDEDIYFDHWLARLVEVIDDYAPDLIWHDASLPSIPEGHHRQYLTYYFNRATERDQEVVVTAKNEELPLEVAVEDYERGRPNEQLDRPWLTDTSITTNGWAYTEEEDLKSPQTVVHELVDIVSKNGCLLLNFGPRPDGTIPETQQQVLRDVGEWLDIHGDAIYETRPWKTFGEGPTRLEDSGHFLDDVEYTSEDVRYTQSKDGSTLYAIVMGWPDGESFTLESVDVASDDGAVGLVGGDDDLAYDVDDGQVTITVPDLGPDERPSDIAVVFELSGFEFE